MWFVVDNDACIKFSLFSGRDVSQGSSATRVRCGGIVNDNFVAYLLVNLSVKKILKIKSVNMWRSYGQYYSGLFFDSQCSSGRQPNFAAFNRGRHLYLAGPTFLVCGNLHTQITLPPSALWSPPFPSTITSMQTTPSCFSHFTRPTSTQASPICKMHFSKSLPGWLPIS